VECDPKILRQNPDPAAEHQACHSDVNHRFTPTWRKDFCTTSVKRQQSSWTYGALANHLWSFAVTSRRQEISATFLQPFVSYTTKTFTTLGVNTESTYDWENEQWTIPFNVSVRQLLKLGQQPIQLSLGGRAYADRPRDGPDWGLRFVVTALFPQ